MKDMVAGLFEGQRVVDRKKKELVQFENMVVGLCSKLATATNPRVFAIKRFDGWQLEWRRPSGVLFLSVSGVPEWTRGHWHTVKSLLEGEPPSYFLRGYPTIEIESCAHRFDLAKLLEIHAALPGAVNALIPFFEGLDKKLEIFLKQTKA